jgi:hypothetical protein
MAKDSWTKDGLATEKAMALSLEMSRTALKSTRQELVPSDMYEFALISFSYTFASRPFEHFETCMESNPIFVIPRRDA